MLTVVREVLLVSIQEVFVLSLWKVERSCGMWDSMSLSEATAWWAPPSPGSTRDVPIMFQSAFLPL